MKTFTAFCRDEAKDTVWINSFQAAGMDAAFAVARKECAADWRVNEDTIEVFGLAEGDIKIVHWED